MDKETPKLVNRILYHKDHGIFSIQDRLILQPDYIENWELYSWSRVLLSLLESIIDLKNAVMETKSE